MNETDIKHFIQEKCTEYNKCIVEKDYSDGIDKPKTKITYYKQKCID